MTTSMTIFNELIKTCHGDLALFASPVCELMTLLLSSTTPELKSSATETVTDSSCPFSAPTHLDGAQFIRFAEHGGIQYELEKYVQYFIDMSSLVDADPLVEREYAPFQYQLVPYPCGVASTG